MSSSKNKPFLFRIFFSILWIFCGLVGLVFAWMLFCGLDRTSTVNALPNNYSVYIRTDSFYDAVEPLVDLKAMDVVLAEPSFSNARQIFYSIRESDLRKNAFVKLAFSRRIDVAMYDGSNFVAIVDMGFLSGISRLAPLFAKFHPVENLYYINESGHSYFEYKKGEKSYYAKIHKNLVIVSESPVYFEKAISLKNTADYSGDELKIMKNRLAQPFRIVANGRNLLKLIGKKNPYINFVADSLSENELSKIEFGISDENINVEIKLPFEKSSEKSNAVLDLIERKSDIPDLLPKLPGAVQYYTLINLGKLSEIKDVAFEVLDEGNINIKRKWNDANALSKTFFKDSLENILFSWTSDEYAVLGLEGKSNPVFVLKIEDEEKRQKVFDILISSIILRSDTSLLLDGVRLPRIEFPNFVVSLLNAMNITLPKPYYMVKDNFIYFSQSPENLASINAALKNGVRLDKDDTWRKVNGNSISPASVSLYYNLEQSVPFFVKGNSLFNKILQLYNIGKLDISTKDNVISARLNSIYSEKRQTQSVQGFPIQLKGNSVPVLYKSENPKNRLIYWYQNPGLIKTFNAASLEVAEKEIAGLDYLVPASKVTFKKNGGEFWAVTKDGLVYLLNQSLDEVESFPIMTGIRPGCRPVVFEDLLIIVGDDDLLHFVKSDGQTFEYAFEDSYQIKNAPAVYGDKIAIYKKGFAGSVNLLTIKAKNPLEISLLEIPVDEIGFGSPCIFENNNQTFVAFVSQAGELYVWDSNGVLANALPLNLEDIFYQNVKYVNDSLIAVSENGTIYKVMLDGSVTKIKLPSLSVKSGYITVCDYNSDKKDEIFICGDSNAIYGFTSDLEFLNAFPVTGYGIPFFMDLNGDKKTDILSLSIDNKLNAWKIN